MLGVVALLAKGTKEEKQENARGCSICGVRLRLHVRGTWSPESDFEQVLWSRAEHAVEVNVADTSIPPSARLLARRISMADLG